MNPLKGTLTPINTENKCGSLYWSNLFDNFATKRIFYMSDIAELDDDNNVRGKHVNNDCNEILVLQKGKINIYLKKDDIEYFFECERNDYVCIPIGYYLEIKIHDKDTCYFVLCDNIR